MSPLPPRTDVTGPTRRVGHRRRAPAADLRRDPARPRAGGTGRGPEPGVQLSPPRHLRAVPPTRRRRRRSRWRGARWAVAATLAVWAALLGAVVFQTVLAEGQHRIDTLRSGFAEEQQRYQRLRLEVARREAPGRVITAARDDLGMVTPDEVTVVGATAEQVAEVWAAPPAPGEGDGTGDPAAAGWGAVKRRSGVTP